VEIRDERIGGMENEDDEGGMTMIIMTLICRRICYQIIFSPSPLPLSNYPTLSLSPPLVHPSASPAPSPNICDTKEASEITGP
jgi:hypothetical protein